MLPSAAAMADLVEGEWHGSTSTLSEALHTHPVLVASSGPMALWGERISARVPWGAAPALEHVHSNGALLLFLRHHQAISESEPLKGVWVKEKNVSPLNV